MFLSTLDERKPIDQFLRCLSEDNRSSQFRIKSANAIVFDEQGQIIALADGSALKMLLRERGWLPELCGHAEKNPLLASQKLALILRECGHVGVAHSWFDLRHDFAEDMILHLCRLPD